MNILPKKAQRYSRIISWSLYDLANQFFALNVISLYFVRWITEEKGVPEILYSVTFGISTFFVAILSPILGTFADIAHKHRLFLIFFTLLCITFTFLLGFVDNVIIALVFFAIANLGCQQAVIFYNALMLNLSKKGNIGFISGLGKMCGYCGAIIALLCTKPIILKHGYQATFILTGVLFFVFALPCMLFVKDTKTTVKMSLLEFLNRDRVFEIIKRLKVTLMNSKRFAGIHDFFKAAFFGLCVVNVLILFMSVYATKVFGLNNVEIINFIIFSAVFALLGSIFSGVLSDRIGCKTTMLGVFISWVLCLLSGGLVRPPFHWIVGAISGASLGATWVVSRAFVMRIAPQEKIGEIFGLFNLIGYIACIIGPLLWGLLVLYFSKYGEIGYRITLLCFIPLLIIGIMFLLRVPSDRKKINKGVQ